MIEVGTPLRRAGAALAAIVALCLLCTAPLTGCSSKSPNVAAPQVSSDKRDALSSLAEAHHKRADIALQQGKRAEAFTEIEALLQTAQSHRGATEGGFDVSFDAAARIARMHLEDGDLDKAEAAARKGLDGAEKAPPSLFHGYLHQILADILEQKKDLRGAVDSHGRAIEIFKSILGERQAPSQSGAPSPKEP